MIGLIWTLVVLLFLLWLIGFAFRLGGALIHILLILAIIGIVFNLLVGRRTV